MLLNGGEQEGGLIRGIADVVGEKHADVRGAAAKDQATNIVVLGEEDSPLRCRFSEKRGVAWVHRPLCGMDDIMAGISQGANGGRGYVGISEDQHYFASTVAPSSVAASATRAAYSRHASMSASSSAG